MSKGRCSRCFLLTTILFSFTKVETRRNHGTRGRRRQQQVIHNATLRLPLQAESGTHHLDIYVGEPPIKRTLIIDTGSRLTAWTCSPCKACGKKRTHYDPAQSSTSSVSLIQANITVAPTCQRSPCHFSDVSVCTNNQCSLEQRYTEGSAWSAYEVTDIITLGGVEPATATSRRTVQDDYDASLLYATLPFTFGCQTSVSGLFENQYADGILGLEFSNYSLAAALQQNGILEEYQSQTTSPDEQPFSPQAFSLCMTLQGGWLGLGGGLVERHKEPMRKTKLRKDTARHETKSKGMYAVKVTDLWLGDKCVTCHTDRRKRRELLESFNEDKGTILDSGTTDTYLPYPIAPIWEALWEKETGTKDAHREIFLTEDELEHLPTVRIVLDGNVSLAIPPMHYMEKGEDKNGKQRRKGNKLAWTSRMYADEPSGAVLGINAMLGHDIMFDWENGQLGVALADCDSSYAVG